MKVTTIGLDLAKNVFQVHGADARGATLLRKQLRRSQMAEFFAKQPPCVVAMEACGSAHHWGRKLRARGHEVRLIAPQYVKPYVKSQKTMRPMPPPSARQLRAGTCSLPDAA